MKEPRASDRVPAADPGSLARDPPLAADPRRPPFAAAEAWRARAARWLGAEATLAAAALLGAALRLDQLQRQIVLDDEWHTLHAILRFGYVRILTHFGWTDVCIPLALYDKMIADTVGLSETWLRLPVVLAGIGSLLVLPLMLRPWLGRGAAAGFAWLLAVAPLHVFFSRFARPYAISLLLAFAGGLALFSWVETSGRRARVLALACLVLGPYFHLSVLPAVVAALGLAVVDAAVRPHAGGVARLGGLVARVAFGLALLVGVPLAVDHAALAYKAGRAQLGVPAARGAIELLGGTASAPALAALALLAVAGGFRLARERPRLLVLLLAMASAAPLAILAARPVSVEEPIVFARYSLLALPVLLLLAAVALAPADDWLRARAGAWPEGALAALAAAGLLALGPLPRSGSRPNNWTNHGMFQYAYDSSALAWHCPQEVSPFYAQLAKEPPGSLRILEAPWWHAWENVYYPCYQQVHRQHMAIGFVAGPRGAMSQGGLPRPAELPLLTPGRPFRFRNFLHVFDNAALERGGIRYVVFHKKLEAEMGIHSADYYEADVTRWIAYYRGAYGAPLYEDEWLAAFDVSHARRGAS